MKRLILVCQSVFLFSSFFNTDYKEIPVKIFKEECHFNDIKINDSVTFFFNEGFDSTVILEFEDSILKETKISNTMSSINNSVVINVKKYKDLDEIKVYVPSKRIKFSSRIDKSYKFVHLYLYNDHCVSTYLNSITLME
jgi:hypothetical protein